MKYRSPLVVAMVKVASKKEVTYDPSTLAHELGHADIHSKNKLVQPLRRIGPIVGGAVTISSNTPWGLVGHVPALLDESYASSKAVDTMRDWDMDEEDIKAAKKRLGVAYSTYAAGPIVDAGLTIGGIASDNGIMRVAGPFAGRLATGVWSPVASRLMERTPIKRVTKEQAKALAAKSHPDTDVHFADRSYPGLGGYLDKPLLEPSEKSLERNKLRKQLGAYIGGKASRKLIRKGGVVIGPSE